MQGVSDLNGISRHQYPPRSEVFYIVGNSTGGGGATSCRVFTTLARYVGSALRPIMDPALGWAVQVMVDGVYSYSFSDIAVVGGHTIYVSLNFNGIPLDYNRMLANGRANPPGTGQFQCIAQGTSVLKAGDILYPIVNEANWADGDNGNSFRVTHIA